ARRNTCTALWSCCMLNFLVGTFHVLGAHGIGRELLATQVFQGILPIYQSRDVSDSRSFFVYRFVAKDLGNPGAGLDALDRQHVEDGRAELLIDFAADVQLACSLRAIYTKAAIE